LHEEFLQKWRPIIKPLITDEDVNDTVAAAATTTTNNKNNNS
jgi:hypothetical protein